MALAHLVMALLAFQELEIVEVLGEVVVQLVVQQIQVLAVRLPQPDRETQEELAAQTHPLFVLVAVAVALVL